MQAAAKRFVEKVAERYAGRKNLILWNAWNEIRNLPIEDCFCKYCRAGYGKYLQKKFGTVEKLNAFKQRVADTVESYNQADGNHTLQYSCGLAFREGAAVQTINQLIALADRRVRQNNA